MLTAEIKQSNRFSLRMKQTITDKGSDVCYFTELNELIYLFHRKELKISVYLLDDRLHHQYDIRMGIKQYVPSGFASSETNNCLYIGNRFGDICVYKIIPRTQQEPDGRVIALDIKPKAAGERPQSISTSSDGRWMMLVAIESAFGRTWGGRLEVYFDDDTIQYRVSIPRYVINPWCVTFLEDAFAVTYGMFKFGIISLNNEGAKIAECNEGLSMPRSIRYSSRDKMVYATDAGNHRILELNKGLKVVSIIHQWEADDENANDTLPIRIVPNHDVSRMIIGMDSGRISMYSVIRHNEAN